MTTKLSLPKVSIQIPCYMQETTIEKAISSALAQTYENLEVIVLDDCSTDKSFKVASEIHDLRLKVFQNKANIGRVKNYHKLLYELVMGEWVVNLDGDDSFSDVRFIERGISYLLQHPEIVLYEGNLKVMNKISLASTKRLDKTHLIVEAIPYLLSYNHHRGFNHMACIYKRSTALQCGFYEFESLNADFQSMMKLGKHGSFILSNSAVGEWNFNAQSASNSIIDPSQHASNLMAMHSLSIYYADKLSKDQLSKLDSELIKLQEYYYFQSQVLLLNKFNALKILLSRVHFSKDYFKVFAIYIRRVFFR